jgi:DNA-binding MarR family transcriptional regulator
MPEPDAHSIAAALLLGVGLLVRRLRQVPVGGDLTTPERSALARLDRGGPATSAALARLEQISPQSMGATLAALEARGLVMRSRDPDDGRQVMLSVTDDGVEVLKARRGARAQTLAAALGASFTAAELESLAKAAPLIERLAESI